MTLREVAFSEDGNYMALMYEYTFGEEPQQQTVHAMLGWDLTKGPDSAPYIIAQHSGDNMPLLQASEPSTLGHELLYTVGDSLRIVDMRKAGSDGNLVQEIVDRDGELRDMREDRDGCWQRCALTASYAAVWARHGGVAVWARSNSQRLRSVWETGLGWALVAGDELICDMGEEVCVYDLTAPNGAPAVRKIGGLGMSWPESVRVCGDQLLRLCAEEHLFSVSTYDVRTGALLREMHCPIKFASSYDASPGTSFTTSGELGWIEYFRDELFVCTMHTHQGFTTCVRIQRPESMGRIMSAPSDARSRMVVARGVPHLLRNIEDQSLIVYTFS